MRVKLTRVGTPLFYDGKCIYLFFSDFAAISEIRVEALPPSIDCIWSFKVLPRKKNWNFQLPIILNNVIRLIQENFFFILD